MQTFNTLVSLLNNRKMQRFSKSLLKRRKQKGGIWYSLLALAVGSIAYAAQRRQINRGLSNVWRTLSNRMGTENEPTTS